MTPEEMQSELKGMKALLDRNSELVQKHQQALVGSEDGEKKGLAHQVILLMETVSSHAQRLASLETSRVIYESSFRAIKTTTALGWSLAGAALTGLAWLWNNFHH